MGKLLLFEIKKIIRSRYSMILLLLLLLAIGTFFIYSHTQAETIEDRMEILEETTAMLEHEHIRDLEKQIEEDPSLEEDHEVQEQLAFLQQQLKEEETELLALQEQDWQTLYSLDIEKDKERIEELEDPYYPFRNMVKWPTDFSERVTYHQMVWLKEHDIKPILPYNIFGTMTIYDRQHDSPEIEESISRYSNKFSTNAFYFLYKFLSYFFSMLGIGFFLFLFADIVTKEGIGAYGPANFLFTQPLTRGKIYISKFLTLIVSTVVVFLDLSFFSLLLGVVFDDLGSWNYPILIYQPEEEFMFMPLLSFIGIASLLFLMVLLFCYSILLLASLLTKRLTIAIGITFIIIIIGTIFSSSADSSWAAFNPFHYFQVYDIVSLEMAALEDNFRMNWQNGLITLAISSALLLSGTYFLARKN
ncbi:MAG TPA: ABC transporter permease subunit [Bacillota bacterium]|nr:ABC transporter permease subunit [Bacillota bacterium]